MRVGLGIVLMALMALVPMPARAAQDTSITIEDGGGCGAPFCYNPATAVAVTGSAVTWTSTSATAHTVTRCTEAVCMGTGPGSGTDGGFGDSGPIAPGAGFAYTFGATGSYNYYCTIHGYQVIRGTVNVQTPATSSSPSTTSVAGVTTTTTTAAGGVTTTTAAGGTGTGTSTIPTTAGTIVTTGVDNGSVASKAAWLVGVGAVLVLLGLDRRRFRPPSGT